MTDKREFLPENAADADKPGDEVLAEFIRRRDAGEQVDVESLCAARPDLADALRSYADGEEYFREMAADDSVSGAGALAETVRPGAGRDTDTSMTGRSFGNYRIVRQLGQGGMGAVYLAEDTTLQRNVALKIPRFTATDSSDARERFFREARSAAALTHPHICPVYHADQMDGTPFIAMAFVDGQPLSRFVGTPEFRDQRRVVDLVRHVADALQHAHDQGFIHRDLKPGNIMLDRDGKPVVTDFGLARRLVPNQESRITQEGQLVGTPAYMSPEQIAGKSEKISSSTDIYALGVVLFELLACRLPFQGSVPEVIAGALKSEPPKLTTLRSDVSLELQALCLQMLQKEPDQRPKSMRDVADRLKKWLDSSSPESTARQKAAQKLKDELTAERQRIAKAVRAGKFESALKRLKALAHREEPEAAEFREWALEQIPRVKARPAEAKRNEPEMLKMAQEWMAKHDYAQAIQILRSIPDLYRSEEAEDLLQEATELQTEADDLLLDLKKCVKDRIYDGIDDNLKRLLVLKPGNQFAKNLQRKLQSYRGGRGKGRPYRFDKQGRLLAINEDNFWTRAMIFSAIVGLAVFGLMTWAITIYLRNGDQEIAVEIDPDWLQEQGGELTLEVDGNEHTLTASGLDLKVALGEHGFTVRHGGTIVHNPQTFSIEKEGQQVLRIDSNGMTFGATPPLAVPSSDKPVEPIIVDAPRTPLPDGPPGLVKMINGHTDIVHGHAASPDGKSVCSISYDKTTRFWDLVSGNEVWKVESDVKLKSIRFHPSGKFILMGTEQFARILEAGTGRELFRLTQPDTNVQRAVWSTDGNKIATGTKDGIRVWDFDGAQAPTLARHIGINLKSAPSGLAFARNNNYLLVGATFTDLDKGKDSTLRLFDVASGTEEQTYVDPVTRDVIKGGGDDLSVSSNGAWVAFKAIDFPGHSWDPIVLEIETGRVVRHPKSQGAPQFSPDGRFLAVGDGTNIRITNDSDRQVWQARHERHAGHRPVFTPDGRFLITAGSWYWDSTTNSMKSDSQNPICVWQLPKEVWPKLASEVPTVSDTAAPMRDGPSLNGLPIVPGTKIIGTYIQNSPVATHDIVVTLNERKGDVWHGVFESLRATQANGGGVTNTGFKYACELTNKSPTTTTLRMTAITGNTSGNTIRDTTSNWLEELTWDGKSLSNAPMKLTPVK